MIDTSLALELVRQRLNRLDHTLDDYLTHTIMAAQDYLTGRGIHLGLRPGDQMLLVYTAVWMYSSRDTTGAQPDWLRKMISDRWLEEGPNGVRQEGLHDP